MQGAYATFPLSFNFSGDGAFGLKKELLIPYKAIRGPLTAEQKAFNHALSSKRQVIERSFATLLGRWSRLRYLNMKSIKKRCEVVAAACCLHNFCINADDMDLDALEMEILEVCELAKSPPLSERNNQM